MKRNKLISILAVFLLAVSLLLSSSVVYAGSNWELLYENDENGANVSGELGELVAAIRGGADIKVDVTWSNNWNQRVDTVYPERVGYLQNGTVVYLMAHVYSFTEDSSGNPTLAEDIRPILLFRTDGVTEVLYYNGSGDTVISHATHNLKIKWFANK